MTEKKFNCYECKYRDEVPGSSHSSCKHPGAKSPQENPLANVMAIFASVGRVPPMQAQSRQLNIRGNQHGIKKGWFNWPWNFDPTWLENCDGYLPKNGGGTLCAGEAQDLQEPKSKRE